MEEISFTELLDFTDMEQYIENAINNLYDITQLPLETLTENDNLNLWNDFNESNTQMYQSHNNVMPMDSTQITAAEQVFPSNNTYTTVGTIMDNNQQQVIYNLDVQYIQPSDTNYIFTTMPSSIPITNENWTSADVQQTAINSQIYSNYNQNTENMDYQNQCDITCNNTLAAQNFFAAEHTSKCDRKIYITQQPDVKYNFSFPCDIEKNIGEITAKYSSKQDKKYITIKVWDECHKWRKYFVKANLYINVENTASPTYKLSHHILVQSTGKNGTIKNFKPILECMTNIDGEYTFKMEKYHIRKTKDYILVSLVNKHLEEELWNEQNLNVNNKNDNIKENHEERIRNKVLTNYPEYTTAHKKESIADTNLCLGFTIYEKLDNGKFEEIGETIFSNTMRPEPKIKQKRGNTKRIKAGDIFKFLAFNVLENDFKIHIYNRNDLNVIIDSSSVQIWKDEIKFKMPCFLNSDKIQQMEYFIEVTRKSDNATSNSIKFTYENSLNMEQLFGIQII